MNIIEETDTLRKTLAAWAKTPEWALLSRYDLLRSKPSLPLRDRALRFVKWLLASAKLTSPHVTSYRWSSALKHTPIMVEARTLLIWALGAEHDELRQACEILSKRLRDCSPPLLPVLVTDVADFAYFSRLGWLVEYLPELSGGGQSYRARKQHYLAWRYRDALVVPITANSASTSEWNVLLEIKT